MAVSAPSEPPTAELLIPPVIVADPLPAKPPLNGRSATLIFLAYFLTQILVGFLAAFIGMAVIIAKNPGAKGKDAFSEPLQEVIAYSALPTMALSGLVVFLLALRKIRPSLRDGSATGAAWLVGTLRQNIAGLMMGIVAAIFFGLLSSIFPPSEDFTSGPISQMAVKPGAQQIMWISVGLLFAPLIEECLFRGILYGGYRHAMGPTGAAVLTTFIFWALHLGETARYWPAMIAIAILALVALWNRLRSSAIGPAVAVHIGYNGMIVLAAILASFSDQ
jgi:membrane protease YdiL (CAAX protease family)